MSNQHQPPKKRRSAWTWILATLGAIVGVFIVLGIIAASTNQVSTSSSDTSASETAEVAAETPAKPTGPARSMSDGVYQVGVDVQAGRYKTAGPSADAPIPNCYWQRATDDSGEFESIIANGNVQGPGSLSIKKGEFVEMSGGCKWTKVN